MSERHGTETHVFVSSRPTFHIFWSLSSKLKVLNFYMLNYDRMAWLKHFNYFKKRLSKLFFKIFRHGDILHSAANFHDHLYYFFFTSSLTEAHLNVYVIDVIFNVFIKFNFSTLAKNTTLLSPNKVMNYCDSVPWWLWTRYCIADDSLLWTTPLGHQDLLFLLAHVSLYFACWGHSVKSIEPTVFCLTGLRQAHWLIHLDELTS